jgi:hypothetical protein
MGRQAQKRASRPRAPEGSHPPPRRPPYSADVTKRRYKDGQVRPARARGARKPPARPPLRAGPSFMGENDPGDLATRLRAPGL